MAKALLIHNARLLDEAIDGHGAVLCVNGKIRAVFQGYFTSPETVKEFVKAVFEEDGIAEDTKVKFFNAKGLTLTPAFIDMHVHFRDPGLTQKEDLNTGLHAAVSGGYGTVVAMPNTNPVISSKEQAEEVMERGRKLGLANLFQSVSITKNFEGKDTSHLEELDPHYVPLITEDGHDVLSSAVMLDGMSIAGSKEIIVSCHCEDPDLAVAARPYRQAALKIMEKYNLPAWGGAAVPENVPGEVVEEIDGNLEQANELLALAENLATERNISIAKQANCHIHICHISTAEAVESVRRAKTALQNEAKEFYADMADAANDARIDGRKFEPVPPVERGFYVTAEATPHHIALTGTEEPDIRALVNPPLRSEDDRIAVIEGLRDGTIDVISTDHAPHTAEDKAKGSPGFTGIEASYAVCNTVLVKEGQISAKRLSQLMSANPARILHLKKGLLKEGYDADLTLTDPDENWVVNSEYFCSKGKATPFNGKRLTGSVRAVFISGNKVLDRLN